MTLRAAIYQLNISELDAMNQLQSEGIISDNAVWLHEVAKEDEQRAVDWLKGLSQ